MRVFFILTISIFVSSCNYIPCSSSSDLTNVKNIPQHSEIAGTYKPDVYTTKDIKGYSNSDSIYLLLTKDGELILKNFPKSTFTDKDYTSDTSIRISGIGSWGCSYKIKTVTIDSRLIQSDSSVFSPIAFDLYKKNNKFAVLLEIGDPDICLAVRLIQQ